MTIQRTQISRQTTTATDKKGFIQHLLSIIPTLMENTELEIIDQTVKGSYVFLACQRTDKPTKHLIAFKVAKFMVNGLEHWGWTVYFDYDIPKNAPMCLNLIRLFVRDNLNWEHAKRGDYPTLYSLIIGFIYRQDKNHLEQAEQAHLYATLKQGAKLDGRYISGSYLVTDFKGGNFWLDVDGRPCKTPLKAIDGFANYNPLAKNHALWQEIM